MLPFAISRPVDNIDKKYLGGGEVPQAIVDYHYGLDAERYAFFRIPKIIMTEPYFDTMSTDAKMLYGLMLDRLYHFCVQCGEQLHQCSGLVL